MVALSVIQGQALLQVRLGQRRTHPDGIRCCPVPDGPPRARPGLAPAGPGSGVAPPARAPVEKLAPHMMKHPQPKEDREELVGLPDLLAQLPGAGIGAFTSGEERLLVACNGAPSVSCSVSSCWARSRRVGQRVEQL